MSQSLDKTRLIIGIIVLIIGQLSPLAIPLLQYFELSNALKATLTGILLFGIPEMFILLTILIVGKSGFQIIKDKLYDKIKWVFPPDEVSKTRYTVGLILFSLVLIQAWCMPYALHLLEQLNLNILYLAIVGDVLLLASLYVLGGNFWDKLRALFSHVSKVN